MTEKDRELIERALTSVWDVRDKLKQYHLQNQSIGEPTSELVTDSIALLTSVTIPTLVTFQGDFAILLANIETRADEAREDIDKLLETTEEIAKEHSILEDEVAALEARVAELEGEGE
jgi:hypothetical protein